MNQSPLIPHPRHPLLKQVKLFLKADSIMVVVPLLFPGSPRSVGTIRHVAKGRKRGSRGEVTGGGTGTSGIGTVA